MGIDEKNLGNEESANHQGADEGQPAEPETPDARIAALEKQVESYKDHFYRKAAEFDNYKKRLENDGAALTRYANEELIYAILPIVDDLERSLKQGKELKESDPFYKGVELIYQKFLKVLTSRGVRTMECVGKEFDVAVHDALLQVPRSDVPPHTVVEEIEKGYLLHDKVIRHAKVIVSSDATPAGPPADEESTAGSDMDDSTQSQVKER